MNLGGIEMSTHCLIWVVGGLVVKRFVKMHFVIFPILTYLKL